MNFSAMFKVLLGGGRVTLNGITYRLSPDGLGISNAATDRLVPITAALLDATGYTAIGPVVPTLNADECYAYFDEEQARWISTTNPQKQKTSGRRVAVFALDQLI